MIYYAHEKVNDVNDILCTRKGNYIYDILCTRKSL